MGRVAASRAPAASRSRSTPILNHANSSTPLVAEADAAMLDAGVRDVRNQGSSSRRQRRPARLLRPLLRRCSTARGSCPTTSTCATLIPYSEHWRVSVGEAQWLQHQIMGYLPGFATPRASCATCRTSEAVGRTNWSRYRHRAGHLHCDQELPRPRSRLADARPSRGPRVLQPHPHPSRGRPGLVGRARAARRVRLKADDRRRLASNAACRRTDRASVPSAGAYGLARRWFGRVAGVWAEKYPLLTLPCAARRSQVARLCGDDTRRAAHAVTVHRSTLGSIDPSRRGVQQRHPAPRGARPGVRRPRHPPDGQFWTVEEDPPRRLRDHGGVGSAASAHRTSAPTLARAGPQDGASVLGLTTCSVPSGRVLDIAGATEAGSTSLASTARRVGAGRRRTPQSAPEHRRRPGPRRSARHLRPRRARREATIGGGSRARDVVVMAATPVRRRCRSSTSWPRSSSTGRTPSRPGSYSACRTSGSHRLESLGSWTRAGRQDCPCPFRTAHRGPGSVAQGVRDCAWTVVIVFMEFDGREKYHRILRCGAVLEQFLLRTRGVRNASSSSRVGLLPDHLGLTDRPTVDRRANPEPDGLCGRPRHEGLRSTCPRLPTLARPPARRTSHESVILGRTFRREVTVSPALGETVAG